MTAFALITPDAVVDGRVAQIIDTFQSNDLTIESLEYVPIEAALMLRLYDGSSYALPGPDGALERISSPLVDRVFDRAPGIIVDFATEPGIFDTVLRIKGATDPFSAEPGSIRRLGRDALINSLHCPDDAGSAQVERAVLTSTPPGSMTAAALDEFIDLDRLALAAGALDLESTLVRVLLRRRANALRHGSKPLLGSIDSADLITFVAQLGAANDSMSRRREFGRWTAEHVASAGDALAILEQLIRETGSKTAVTDSETLNPGALCRHDQDLLELGLAVERSRLRTR